MTRELKLQVFDGENLVNIDRENFDLVFSGLPVRRFTGLKDKNGKEMYEKDVIRYSITREGQVISFNAEVKFKNGCFIYDFNRDVVFTNITHNTGLLNTNLEFSEVIGNIYQNPELLEQNKAS